MRMRKSRQEKYKEEQGRKRKEKELGSKRNEKV